jgi:hypothetical protein
VKLAFISPIPHLSAIDGKGDFSFALGHIAIGSAAYRTYFKKRSLTGFEVMLDNGAYELGGSIPADQMIELVREIQPTSAYGMDYPGDPERTKHEVDQFGIRLKREGLRERVKNVGCVQGVDARTWIDCYQHFVNSPHVDIIAVPVMTLSDIEFQSIDPRYREGQTRWRMLKSIKEEYGFHKPIHLTGLDYPYELWCEEYKDPMIMSNDSTSCVVHGTQEIMFDRAGEYWPGKYRTLMDFSRKLSQRELWFVQENIRILRRGFDVGS